MNNNIQFSYGSPVSSEKKLRSFLKHASKTYQIEWDTENIIDLLVAEWKKDQEKNQHCVIFRNEKYEWFVQFISDKEVVKQIETEKTVPSELFITEVKNYTNL